MTVNSADYLCGLGMSAPLASYIAPLLGGGSSTLTANTTATSGFTAGQYLYSDGSKLQAGSFGTGVATALAANVNGSGAISLTTSPSFVTPTLGVASATTINKVTLTAPATGSTLTIADGKTLTTSNTLTLAAGADSQTWTFPSTSDTVACLGTVQSFSAAQTFNASVTLGSAQQLLWSTDLILTRAGAGNIRLGATDAASPVAQKIQVQSVVAGTTDTAGATTTIQGSVGTGAGSPGAINFAVGTVGNSTANTQNAAATILSILSQGNNGTDASTNVRITPTWNTSGAPTAFLVNPTNTASSSSSLLMDLQVGGSSKLKVDRFGRTTFTDTNGNITITSSSGQTALSIGAGSLISFGNSVILGGPASSTLQSGPADAASPTAQTFQAQSVVAGTSNIAGVDWTHNGSRGTGTGAGGKIIFQTAPAGSSGSSQNALAAGLTITAPAVNMQPSAVVGNQALALSATDGFLYIPSCAGIPSGTPTSFTGRVPMVYDSTNNNFYIYNSGWKKTTTFS